MSVSHETIDNIKNKLIQNSNIGMKTNNNMYSHLMETFSRINLHNQTDAWENFEEISGLVKRSNFQVAKSNNPAAQEAEEAEC